MGILRTHNGLDAFACLSAMQKCIRRGMEREAMEFAVELAHTGKNFFTMVCNRLEIVAHEDVGLADMWAVMFTMQSLDLARRQYKDNADKVGRWRMVIGNVIRALSRAYKSREGDHFQAVTGVPNLEHKKAPTIPNWAYDMHTIRGRKEGCGLDHFREVSAKLVPEPKTKDAYEDECYAIWQQKHEAADAGKSPQQRQHVAGKTARPVDRQLPLL